MKATKERWGKKEYTLWLSIGRYADYYIEGLTTKKEKKLYLEQVFAFEELSSSESDSEYWDELWVPDENENRNRSEWEIENNEKQRRWDLIEKQELENMDWEEEFYERETQIVEMAMTQAIKDTKLRRTSSFDFRGPSMVTSPRNGKGVRRKFFTFDPLTHRVTAEKHKKSSETTPFPDGLTSDGNNTIIVTDTSDTGENDNHNENGTTNTTDSKTKNKSNEGNPRNNQSENKSTDNKHRSNRSNPLNGLTEEPLQRRMVQSLTMGGRLLLEDIRAYNVNWLHSVSEKEDDKYREGYDRSAHALWNELCKKKGSSSKATGSPDPSLSSKTSSKETLQPPNDKQHSTQPQKNKKMRKLSSSKENLPHQSDKPPKSPKKTANTTSSSKDSKSSSKESAQQPENRQTTPQQQKNKETKKNLNSPLRWTAPEISPTTGRRRTASVVELNVAFYERQSVDDFYCSKQENRSPLLRTRSAETPKIESRIDREEFVSPQKLHSDSWVELKLELGDDGLPLEFDKRHSLPVNFDPARKGIPAHRVASFPIPSEHNPPTKSGRLHASLPVNTFPREYADLHFPESDYLKRQRLRKSYQKKKRRPRARDQFSKNARRKHGRSPSGSFMFDSSKAKNLSNILLSPRNKKGKKKSKELDNSDVSLHHATDV